MLLAFCGIDGSGKTTQLNRLFNRLQATEQDVVVTKQPTNWYRNDPRLRAFLNEELEENELLLRELALFAASDRLRHVQTEILPNLQAGKTVISDRYVFSTYAYFLARGLEDFDWLHALNRFAPLPDATFYLDVPVQVAVERILSRDGQFAKKEEVNLQRMNKVRDCFLAKPWGDIANFHILDGLQPVETIEQQIIEIVHQTQARRKTTCS